MPKDKTLTKSVKEDINAHFELLLSAVQTYIKDEEAFLRSSFQKTIDGITEDFPTTIGKISRLILHRRNSPPGLAWNVSGAEIVSLNTINKEHSQNMLESLAARNIFRASLHRHSTLGFILRTYTDGNKPMFKNQYYERLDFAYFEDHAKAISVSRICTNCFGTGIIDGFKPKEGPWPTKGTSCKQCKGEGYNHDWGVVLNDISETLVNRRFKAPQTWIYLAAHNKD